MKDSRMPDTDGIEITEQILAFGRNLRNARGRAGLTQAQLSSSAPLDRAAISRLECGERAPDMLTLLRLCRVLQVEPSDLLRGVGSSASSIRAGGRQANGAGDDPAAVFGANLKWARRRAGMSQERLALDAKVDRAAISVYEKGGREPNLRTVLKLALKLDIRPGALFKGISLDASGGRSDTKAAGR